jgi:hypothetical protein
MEDIIDSHGQTDLGLPFAGISKAEVGEYVPRTLYDFPVGTHRSPSQF